MPRPFSDDERARIRLALLSAGRRALATGGVRKTPVAWFCREADISKGAFYQFFDSKEALVVDLLQEAEAEVRTALDAAAEQEDGLRAVLHGIFSALTDHPLLHLLADPEEVAWLERSLGSELLDQARADDDRYFAGLFGRLRGRGQLREGLPDDVLVALAPAAMALAQGSRWIGAAEEGVRELVVEGLIARLRPEH